MSNRFLVVIGVTVALVSLTLLMISSTFRQNDDYEKCLLYELNQHRLNSYDADRDIAQGHDMPFNVPAPAPVNLGVSAELQAACERIAVK